MAPLAVINISPPSSKVSSYPDFAGLCQLKERSKGRVGGPLEQPISYLEKIALKSMAPDSIDL